MGEIMMIKIDVQSVSQIDRLLINTEPDGENDDIEILFDPHASFINVTDPLLAGFLNGNDVGYLGFDKSDACFLNTPVVIPLEIFAMGSDVHVEDCRIQRLFAVLFCQHRFFDGIGAAGRRAISLCAGMHTSGADALQPGYFFRFLLIRRAYQVAAKGSGCGEYPFKFEGCNDVRGLSIPIDIMKFRIVYLAAAGQDNGAHIQFDDFILHGMVDGIHAAECGADLTPAGLEMDALVSIDGRCIGHRLCIGHIDRFPAFEAHIVLGGYQLKRLSGDVFSNRIQGDMPGGTDIGASTASDTGIGLLMEGGVYLEIDPPIGQIDGVGSHFLADPNAKPAENTGILLTGETGFFDPILGGQLFYDGHIRTPGHQHLDNQLTTLMDRLGVGRNLHALPNRVVAGGNKTRPSPIEHFHGAQAAHPCRLQGLVVA